MSGRRRRVAITHAAALSSYGPTADGIAHALATGSALAGMPDETPLATPRVRKMMSRGAYLAARCLSDLLARSGWSTGREHTGYFLGVGASGGALDDVTALLEASITDGAFSLPRFGDRGLAACNPLLAFQLMNNFTMCHGAILEGLGGPNGALFSRGAGTIAALEEAVCAVASGDCDRAIAGGADAATHPVTIAELDRDGFLRRGLVPADGAALLALAEATGDEDIAIDGCAHASGRDRPVPEALEDAWERASEGGARDAGPVDGADVVVIAPWGPPAGDALRSFGARLVPRADVIDTTALGETLAASPALALAVAHDALRGRASRRRAVVLALGVDGDPGVVVLSRAAIEPEAPR